MLSDAVLHAVAAAFSNVNCCARCFVQDTAKEVVEGLQGTSLFLVGMMGRWEGAGTRLLCCTHASAEWEACTHSLACLQAYLPTSTTWR